MNNDFLNAFLASFDDSPYPAEFLERYTMMECLAQQDGGETFLVREKESGAYYVAKCFPKAADMRYDAEMEMLGIGRIKGLPDFKGAFENETCLCVVRAYVPGLPLDQAARETPFSREQAVSIAVQVCASLACLHSRQPPIIHRDIKPQNIILDAQGGATLIDFGIARLYDRDAHEDTVCFGTRDFAAPEQFGFAQTDARTDIYALGVLLGWMLTGACDMNTIKQKLPPGRLRNIVLKCCAFDPCDRYKNVTQVQDALSGRTRRRIGLAAALGVGLAGLGLVLFAKTGVWQKPIRFKEPQVEKAARLSLDIPEGIALTEADLLAVQEIFIFGGQAAEDEAAYRTLVDEFAHHFAAAQRGTITSLEDLAMFRNLRRLRLGFQRISDISPLAALPVLELVDLNHNPLSDITALAQVKALQSLALFDTTVTDLSVLAACPRLEFLDIGKTPISALSAFNGLAGLRELHMGGLSLQTLQGITAFPLLERVYLPGVRVADLTPLLELSNLKYIEVDDNLCAAAEQIASQAAFQIICP